MENIFPGAQRVVKTPSIQDIFHSGQLIHGLCQKWVKQGASAAGQAALGGRSPARICARKTNFAFQQGARSVIKLSMQTIAACLRQASVNLHLSSNELRSFGPPAVVG
jgi:hypothetical protein